MTGMDGVKAVPEWQLHTCYVAEEQMGSPTREANTASATVRWVVMKRDHLH